MQQGPNFSNLIHIDLITLRCKFFNNSIKIATGNVQSLKNKEQTLLHELKELDTDIMLITETWLIKDDIIWLDSYDFNKDTYRTKSAYHPNWQRRRTCPLMVSKKTITITGIYHPPPKDNITNAMFIDDITDQLTSLLPDPKIMSHTRVL